MDKDKFLIHVELAERNYGLWIRREEEEVVREAAKRIRNKMFQYRRKYARKDVSVKDLLAMVALQLSIDNLQMEDKNDTVPFTSKIQDITEKIELYLKGE